jgi:hypothetical protein
MNQLPQALARSDIKQRNGKENDRQKKQQKIPHGVPFIDTQTNESL